MKNAIDILKGFLWGVAVCAIISMLAGCRTTEYVPMENVRTVYQDRVRTVHDTVLDTVLKHNFILQKDSMAVEVKGDTVYVDRWHTFIGTKIESIRHNESSTQADSAQAARVDSVSVPYPVERKLTRWEQVKMDAGGIAIVVAGVALLGGIAVLLYFMTGGRWNKRKFTA